MQTLEKNALFTELTAEESAEINGACYYYYQPSSYYSNPCSRPCYNPCNYYNGYNSYGSSYGYGYGYGNGYGSGYGSGSYQTTNVNVLVRD